MRGRRFVNNSHTDVLCDTSPPSFEFEIPQKPIIAPLRIATGVKGKLTHPNFLTGTPTNVAAKIRAG